MTFDLAQVCDDDWDMSDGDVVCNQLFPGSEAVSVALQYGQAAPSVPIWMDDLGCDGIEENIAFCGFPGWRQHNCDHTEDAGVACQPPTATPTTATPTYAPTTKPSSQPTPNPTSVPTSKPTSVPTSAPTSAPTPMPTPLPSPAPTAPPTPTPVPTPAPTTPAPTTRAPTPKPTELSGAIYLEGMSVAEALAHEAVFERGIASVALGAEADDDDLVVDVTDVSETNSRRRLLHGGHHAALVSYFATIHNPDLVESALTALREAEPSTFESAFLAAASPGAVRDAFNSLAVTDIVPPTVVEEPADESSKKKSSGATTFLIVLVVWVAVLVLLCSVFCGCVCVL